MSANNSKMRIDFIDIGASGILDPRDDQVISQGAACLYLFIS